MYSSFQIAVKYFQYYLHADNSKGHGVHSPFVYDFIVNVLNHQTKDERFRVIEYYRSRLLRDHRMISVQDFGAGSTTMAGKERKLSDIAASSLKNRKYASLLFRVARYYGCKNIVELGTSLGTTTAYLALASGYTRVTTLEGSERIADIAEDFFEHAGFDQIRLIRGNFADTLPSFLESASTPDLVFIDGNHQEQPTMTYFESFLRLANPDTIFVFDDIHWSEGMERAWEEIKAHPSVTLTIDLFFLGLVFLRKEFMVKQHFEVRF